MVRRHLGKIVFSVFLFVALGVCIREAARATASPPIFYCSLDKGNGGRVRDSIGNLQGTLTNMDSTTNTDWVAGKNFWGLDFDGTNDRIAFGDVLDFTSAAMTICAWINMRTYGEGSLGRIVDKNNAASSGYAFIVRNSTAQNQLALFINSTSVGVFSNDNAVATGSWIHAAVSYNGSNASFYANGVAVGSPALTTVPTGNTEVFNIGNRTSEDRTFDGVIDDVRIYNVALSATDIVEIFNTTKRGHSIPYH